MAEKRFKGNTQFIFLYNPQKSLVNVCLMKNTVTKKVIVFFMANVKKTF